MAVIHLSGAAELERAAAGGKAWGINHMRSLGMPVPAAFVVTTDECLRHLDRDGLDSASVERIRAAVGELEDEAGRAYRAHHRIPDTGGTSVTVQATLTDWVRQHGGAGNTTVQVFRSLAG